MQVAGTLKTDTAGSSGAASGTIRAGGAVELGRGAEFVA